MTIRNVIARLDICRDIIETQDMQITGTDLKVERVKANVRIIDLAARMGLSRQTVWGIERAGRVHPMRAAQYRDALMTFDDVTSEGSAA